jgi:hypothetical protein
MRSSVRDHLVAFAWRNGWVLFYVVLIIACVLLAPEEEIKFIYTEF